MQSKRHLHLYALVHILDYYSSAAIQFFKQALIMKPTVSKANLSFVQVVQKNQYTIVIMTTIELSQLNNVFNYS